MKLAVFVIFIPTFRRPESKNGSETCWLAAALLTAASVSHERAMWLLQWLPFRNYLLHSYAEFVVSQSDLP